MKSIKRTYLIVAAVLCTASVSLPMFAASADSGDVSTMSDTLTADVKAAAAKGDSAAVALLAKNNPGFAAEIAGIAAAQDPDHSADYAGAVAAVAPADQADEIAAAAADPDHAAEVAAAVVKAQPDAEVDIVAAVADATGENETKLARQVSKDLGRSSKQAALLAKQLKKLKLTKARNARDARVAALLKRLSKLSPAKAQLYQRNIVVFKSLALQSQQLQLQQQFLSLSNKIQVNKKGDAVQASNDGSSG